MALAPRQTISSSSNPLFSAIVALSTLIFIYFPSPFRGTFFSPVIVSTSVLFLSLLRLSASQRTARLDRPVSESTPRDSTNDDAGLGPDPNPIHDNSFVEWDVRSPLKAIREDCGGDGEDQDGDVLVGKRAADIDGAIERYASLSLYYPETDSDCSSSDGDFPGTGEWDLPENECFRWDREDREELIEIKLDWIEEDNLIEIDPFPATANVGFCDEILN